MTLRAKVNPVPDPDPSDGVRRIVVRSLYDPATGTRPDLWEAVDEDGTVLTTNVVDPFLSACRALLRGGLDPLTWVTMQIDGSPSISFIPIQLFRVAKLAVSERDTRSVRFGRWKPFEHLDGRRRKAD